MALAAVALSLVPASGAGAQERPAFPGADSLSFPTNMGFSPDGRLFFTEKDTGRIRIVENGKLLPTPFATLNVVPGGETGLLGLALDPAFPRRPWVYVYYTDAADGRNRLVRIEAHGDTGGAPQTLLDLLPATGIHNGGDLAFGADGKLYVTVGETGQMSRAQDVNDLGGKVLRLNPDGSVPPDNPFGSDNPAFTMGLRNSFGLCVDPKTGALWETENGPTQDDEVNLIRAGGNYGWPAQLGPGGAPKYVDPQLVFPQVIVPTGCAVVGRFLYFGDFHGDLHRASIDGSQLGEQAVVEHLPSGITDVLLGPNGDLYVATSSSIVRVPVGGAYEEPSDSATPTVAPPSSAAGGGSTPAASGPPSSGGGSSTIFWVLPALLAAAAGAALFAMRLLSSRLRDVRRPGEAGDADGPRSPPAPG
ncbi:MAG: PQQ-dependent sugar dehydrogenase [Actinomycetota bacterium]|nr:PQQ-dependent sugar dehydrogenase [Actinomycetota bacterium]